MWRLCQNIEGGGVLRQAYEVAHTTLHLNAQTGDGIQGDGSFHQHGAQLYSGWGYGGIFTTNVLVLEGYAQGTNWTIPDPQFELCVKQQQQ